MTRNYIALWALLSALATAGCAGSSGTWNRPEPRSLGRDTPAFLAPEGPHERAETDIEEPTGDLTVRQALALALLRNPGLAAFSWQIRVREAEALQVGLRPNPQLGVELENVAGGGTLRGLGASETTVSLSQLIELGGKRGKRRELAGLEQSLAMWDYEAHRLDVFTEVVQTFVSVLAAQQRTQISRDLVEVAEQFRKTVSRRVQAGAVSPVEETRARVALSSSRLELQAATRQLAVERGRLAALWGSSAPRFSRAMGNLDDVGEPVPLDRLLERVEENPDVARWLTEVERRRADLALQRSLGTPDVSVVGGVRHLAETSDNAFVLGFEIPLPVADRNQGGTLSAEYRLAKSREEQRSARVTVQAALALTHETWSAAHGEITTLDQEILPDAELALETAQDAYRRGLFRLTDVLDTRRTLFELRARRTDALERYHQAQAELERLTGEALTNNRRR